MLTGFLISFSGPCGFSSTLRMLTENANLSGTSGSMEWANSARFCWCWSVEGSNSVRRFRETYQLDPGSEEIKLGHFYSGVTCKFPPFTDNTIRKVNRPPLRIVAHSSPPLSCKRQYWKEFASCTHVPPLASLLSTKRRVWRLLSRCGLLMASNSVLSIRIGCPLRNLPVKPFAKSVGRIVHSSWFVSNAM